MHTKKEVRIVLTSFFMGSYSVFLWSVYIFNQCHYAIFDMHTQF